MYTRLASLFFVSAIAAGCVSNAAAADSFTIKGFLPGIADSTKVNLVNVEGAEPKMIAEAITTDGNFTLSGSVDMPSMCEMAFFQVRNKNSGFYRLLSSRIMVENSDIDVSYTLSLDSIAKINPFVVNEKFMKVSGSRSHDQFAEYLAKYAAAEENVKVIGLKHAGKWMETQNHPDTMAIYDKKKFEAEAGLAAAMRDFIASHPAYHFSAYLTVKELSKIFAYTSDEIKAMVESVKACPDTARVNFVCKAGERAMKHCLGQKFFDFNVDNTDGVARPMSSYVTPGKYTFIDFWASWCSPCRAAIPHVRKLHEQYAGKLNVYSISCDEDKADWDKAKKKKKMEWTQLRLNPEQIKEPSRAYAISTIPRLILIDPAGRLVCSTNRPIDIDVYLENNLK